MKKDSANVKRANHIPIIIVIFILFAFVAIVLKIAVSRANKETQKYEEKLETNLAPENIIDNLVGDHKAGLLRPFNQEEKNNKITDSNYYVENTLPVYLSNPIAPKTLNNTFRNISDPGLKNHDKEKIQLLKKALIAKTDVVLGKKDFFESNYPTSIYSSEVPLSLLSGLSENRFVPERKDKWTLKEKVQKPKSRFVLQTGFVIPAILISTINSDIAGQVIAQISRNVFDSKTGDYLLLPQGSKLIGNYSSDVAYGQSRILVNWKRIIFPNGDSLDIGEMPGTDNEGMAGFTDKIDNHYGRVFGSAILMSAIVGGMSYAINKNNNIETTTKTLKSEMMASFADQIGNTSLKIIEKNIDISPTLVIRSGFKFNVMLTKDLVFNAPYKD